MRLGLVVLVLSVPLIMAPAPGAVGSCDSDATGFVELADYCQEREELICVRRALRLEISEEERDDCRREVIELCQRRFWAEDCRPTERQANACLNALRSRDTLEVQEEDIDECAVKALCTVRTEARSIDAGRAE